MALINEHFLKLQNNYLFSDIAKKVNSFKVTHPKAKLIRMGIGDVTQPLAPAVIEAMHKAVDEMAHKETFHGYGPEQGYPFLIDAIIKNDYASRGISLEPSEVFISDGAKSDTGNMPHKNNNIFLVIFYLLLFTSIMFLFACNRSQPTVIGTPFMAIPKLMPGQTFNLPENILQLCSRNHL